MGSLSLASKTFFTGRTQLPWFSSEKRTTTTTTTRTRIVYLNQRKNNKVFASRSREEEEEEEEEESPQFDSYDLMEIKFGRLLGEDPKLTLAKIMGRKANPDASYLDIEKSFYNKKKKGKVVEVEELPFEIERPRGRNSPAKGLQFKPDDKKVAMVIKKPDPNPSKSGNVRKSSVPNVILRKPTVYKDDDDENSSSRLMMRPNLSLKMRSAQVKEKFSDMTLLRKPEAPIANDTDSELKTWKEEPSDVVGNLTLLEQPHRPSGEKEEEQFGDARVIVPNDGMEQLELRQTEVHHQEPTNLNQPSDLNSVSSKTELSVEAAVQGKPKRLDQYTKGTSKSVGEETASLDPRGCKNNEELGNLVDASDFQESKDADWTKAEDLIKTGNREYVELVSCNTKGFIVSFGTLVGILPYRNLLSKWKFLAFESWLRQKGLDPSMYKKNLGTMTNYDAENKNFSPDSPSHVENGGKVEDKISPDMKLEDLLRIYDQEKIKYLSSFIGQKINAYVLLADRKLKKLIFSLRPKENEELAEKKKNLMARLQVGDIVKCRIQKITYFGIFVEVEGVSALIHQSELSWDATSNPSNYFKIDQVVDAKVHQLNFALGRIFLSLKEVTPDPLMDSLESVVGDLEPFDERLEAAQTDVEWSEVESLIKELQNIEGVQSVSKGRFFRSPGLAPTFQVYMASMFENQYKLLARSGNKIQEVMVQTSLDKERMKSAIMTCANRVE